MGKHRAENRPACGCAEGYFVNSRRVELLTPAAHDCEYIHRRNAGLDAAVCLADALFPRPTIAKSVPAWRAEWAGAFHAAVSRLYWMRYGDDGKTETGGPAPVAG
jgi:hypothetical protein